MEAIISTPLGPRVYSFSNTNEWQKQGGKILKSRALPEREADILTGICEPIF
jgi:hypothetical protein